MHIPHLPGNGGHCGYPKPTPQERGDERVVGSTRSTSSAWSACHGGSGEGFGRWISTNKKYEVNVVIATKRHLKVRKCLTLFRMRKNWWTISPAYDPNSKDTWNSHAFCVGTHWKSENAHQCSSPKHQKPWPKHHRSITTRHWDTKASPTQSRDITNTKPRHHPHITKTSQHNHYTSPRHAKDITNTSLKDHQNITSTCRKHLDTPPKNHWNISEISPNHPWNTNKT